MSLFKLHSRLALAALCLAFGSPCGRAQDAAAPAAPGPSAAPAEPSAPDAGASYRLGAGDTVRVAVYDEPDLGAEQRIDEKGLVRLPLVGALPLAGLNLREAERAVERAYVEGRFLRAPQATVTIVAFRPREVLALGELGSPGKVSFPAGVDSLDILEVVSLAGGFTKLAKSWEVRLTRIGPEGREETVTLDVDRMIAGKRANDGSPASGRRVYPGDKIFVPTRIF